MRRENLLYFFYITIKAKIQGEKLRALVYYEGLNSGSETSKKFVSIIVGTLSPPLARCDRHPGSKSHSEIREIIIHLVTLTPYLTNL